MIINKADITDLYPPDVLDLDDSEKDENEKTAFDRYLDRQSVIAERRLRGWIGDEPCDDAESVTPIDSVRAVLVKESFFQLVCSRCTDRALQLKLSGSIVQTQSPGGSKVVFTDWPVEAFQKEIHRQVMEAYNQVLEYI